MVEVIPPRYITPRRITTTARREFLKDLIVPAIIAALVISNMVFATKLIEARHALLNSTITDRATQCFGAPLINAKEIK